MQRQSNHTTTDNSMPTADENQQMESKPTEEEEDKPRDKRKLSASFLAKVRAGVLDKVRESRGMLYLDAELISVLSNMSPQVVTKHDVRNDTGDNHSDKDRKATEEETPLPEVVYLSADLFVSITKFMETVDKVLQNACYDDLVWKKKAEHHPDLNTREKTTNGLENREKTTIESQKKPEAQTEALSKSPAVSSTTCANNGKAGVCVFDSLDELKPQMPKGKDTSDAHNMNANKYMLESPVSLNDKNNKLGYFVRRFLQKIK